MDLLKAHKRRTKLSEAAYIVLNLALPIALLSIVLASQTPWLAFGLVLLSKWRALAVRPRFWFANLVANMVDILVGMSVVVLLYAATGSLWLQWLLAILYAGWLLFIKPRSSRKYVAAQAGIAVFLGITALSIVSYSWNIVFFVLVMWLIGYTSTRHVISSYDEPHTGLYSLISAFVFAELGWIGYHWLAAYPLPGFETIQFSQLALFVTLYSFIAERAYASYQKHGVVKRSDVIMPVVLTVAIMVAIYIIAVVRGSDAL